VPDQPASIRNRRPSLTGAQARSRTRPSSSRPRRRPILRLVR
jgi:hypothetical protein